MSAAAAMTVETDAPDAPEFPDPAKAAALTPDASARLAQEITSAENALALAHLRVAEAHKAAADAQPWQRVAERQHEVARAHARVADLWRHCDFTARTAPRRELAERSCELAAALTKLAREKVLLADDLAADAQW